MWNDVNLTISINQKAIKLFGLETAAYFAVITQIVPRVMAKQTADANGFFPLDRHYVEEQVGLSLEKQYNCDTILVKNGILIESPESRDKITVDLKRYFGILTESDPDKLSEITKRSILSKTTLERDASNARAAIRAEERAKKAEQLELERIRKEEKKKQDAENKAAKDMAIRNGMKAYAIAQPLIKTAELQDKIQIWVDSIYDAKSFLTRAAIDIFCRKLNEFSVNSKTNPAELLDIAAARSYKDAGWVISVYESQHPNGAKVSAVKVQQEQKIGSVDTVNTDVSF